ncbi:hemicentin-2-like isoform X2 [Symsagittifera roscoffensis]|uniref:hemicentin-2-like isoform X2 n=1 Tax=Symsagittifera roscoffensis TaxID=84072 RepID=UPI00307CBD62
MVISNKSNILKILFIICVSVESLMSDSVEGSDVDRKRIAAITSSPDINPLDPSTLYMHDEYITLPSEVEAVTGVDDDVTIRCRFGGFQPPRPENSHMWSISWTKLGRDFSLLTNFAGQIFSKNEDSKYSFVNMSDGSGECSMRIGDVGEGDQGIYQIEINYNVPLKKQVYLYMTDPAGPTGVVVNSTLGDDGMILQNEPTVKLNCFVFGAHPKVGFVVWKKDNDLLNMSSLAGKTTDGVIGPHPSSSSSSTSPRRFMTAAEKQGRHFEHFSLTLLNVQLDDSGLYSCEAHNPFGSVKGSTRINVRSQPNIEFKVVPSPYAKVGERRVLQCSDSHASFPEPTLQIEQQWDSKMLAKSRGHLTAFVIGRVGRDQAGVYECKAENEEGKVMAVTQLFVQYLDMYLLVPAIGQPNGSLLVAQDDLLFVSCVVKSSPRAHISWIRKDNPSKILAETDGASELALKVQPVTKKDVGVYRCTAKVTFHDKSAEFRFRDVRISVIRAARILRIVPTPDKESVITFNEDETARVQCVFSDGYPPSKAQWLLKGDPVPTVTRSTSTKAKETQGETKEGEGEEVVHVLTLILQKLRPEDSGRYICEVTNSESPASVRQVDVAVKTVPRVVLQVLPLSVAVQGENRTVSCVDTANSYPPPEMYLSHHGQMGTVLKSSSNHSLIFPLDNIQPHVGGVWTCGATNEVGSSVEVNTTVIVHFKPVLELTADKTELKEGETFEASCVSTSSPSPTRMQWLHLNTGIVLTQIPLGGNPNRRTHSVPHYRRKTDAAFPSSSVTKLDLVLPRISPQKSGTLVCVGENEMYNGQRLVSRKSLNLTVQNPPKNMHIYPHVDKVTAAEGDDVQLKCVYDEGLPASLTEWTFRSHGRITSAAGGQKGTPGVFGGASEDLVRVSPSRSKVVDGIGYSWLDVNRITKYQSGVYTCSAWSSLFPLKINKTISVDVVYPPTKPILELRSPQTLQFPRGTLKAKCTSNYSNPKAVIHWYLEGVQLIDEQGGGDTVIVNSDDLIEEGETGERVQLMATSSLATPALRSMDGKSLWCQAHNSRFPNSHSMSNRVPLEVLFPPEIKYTKNAYPMSHESATIECLAHGNPTPTINWYYDYPSPSSNKGPLNTTDNVKIVTEVNSNRKKVLGKLTVEEIGKSGSGGRGLLGSYRCEATSALSTDFKVSEIVNITEAVRPSAPSVTGVAENVGMLSVNVTWQPPRDQSHLKNAWFQVGYQTEYRSFSSPIHPSQGHVGGSQSPQPHPSESTIVTSVVEEQIPPNVFEYTVKGLVGGRKYTVLVRTCNKVGCSNSDFKSILLSFVSKSSLVVSPNSGGSTPRHGELGSDSAQLGVIGGRDGGPQMTILEIILLLVIGCLSIALLYLLGMLMLSIRKIKTLQEKTRILDTPSFAAMPNDFVVGTNCSSPQKIGPRMMAFGSSHDYSHTQRGLGSPPCQTTTLLHGSYRDTSRI